MGNTGDIETIQSHGVCPVAPHDQIYTQPIFEYNAIPSACTSSTTVIITSITTVLS